MLLVVGYAIGAIVTMLIFRLFIVGVLQVVRLENEDQPYLFLELSKDVNSVINKDYVILKVNTKKGDSQK